MGLTSDLHVLYNLAFTRVRGATHGERLDSFYRTKPAITTPSVAAFCTAVKR